MIIPQLLVLQKTNLPTWAISHNELFFSAPQTNLIDLWTF